MATARYWRIYIETTYGTIHSGLAEIQMRGVAAGADLTGSGTALSSGDYNGTYSKNFAFDDNTADGWVSTNGAGDGSWIGYDFGSDVEIVEVDLLPRPSATTQAPRAFRVEYSSDGISWSELKGYLAATWTSGVSQTFAVPLTFEPPGAIIYSAGVQVMRQPANAPVRVYSAGVQVMRRVAVIVPPDPGGRRRHASMMIG